MIPNPQHLLLRPVPRVRPVFAALIAALLLALCLGPAFAAAPAEIDTMLAGARKQLDEIRKRVVARQDAARQETAAVLADIAGRYQVGEPGEARAALRTVIDALSSDDAQAVQPVA